MSGQDTIMLFPWNQDGWIDLNGSYYNANPTNLKVKYEKEVFANENKELKSNLKELNVNLNNMVSENKQLHELNLNLEQVKCEILENTNSLSNVNTEMKLKIIQLIL